MRANVKRGREEMTELVDRGVAAGDIGTVFRWPAAYDLLLHMFWGRNERAYRSKVIDLAALARGESVLDIGCGTGTLAIAAKQRMRAVGEAVGIDASVEMIARARRKAARAGVVVEFKVATAQDLPFGSGSFDVVLCTTVCHCLPQDTWRPAFGEMRRVLKRGGRAVVVDFGGAREDRHSFMAHLRHHRDFDLRVIVPILRDVGFTNMEIAPLGFSDLHVALAT
jgi:ubiquinone/menaquinone biosynthesis C-methylase UbiE